MHPLGRRVGQTDGGRSEAMAGALLKTALEELRSLQDKSNAMKHNLVYCWQQLYPPIQKIVQVSDLSTALNQPNFSKFVKQPEFLKRQHENFAIIFQPTDFLKMFHGPRVCLFLTKQGAVTPSVTEDQIDDAKVSLGVNS